MLFDIYSSLINKKFCVLKVVLELFLKGIHKGAGLAVLAPDSGLQIVSTINSALIQLAEEENNITKTKAYNNHVIFSFRSNLF